MHDCGAGIIILKNLAGICEVFCSHRP